MQLSRCLEFLQWLRGWRWCHGERKRTFAQLEGFFFWILLGEVTNVASHYFFRIQDNLPRLPGGDFMGHLVHHFFHAVFGRDWKGAGFFCGKSQASATTLSIRCCPFCFEQAAAMSTEDAGGVRAKRSAQMCQTWNNHHSIVTTHRWNSCIILSRNPWSFHLFCLQLILMSLTFQCFEVHFQMFLWRCWCHVPPAALCPTLSAALCPSRRGLSWRRERGNSWLHSVETNWVKSGNFLWNRWKFW